MRPILVLLLTSVLLPAIDLTGFTSFAGTEEQTLVFSYADLLGKATVTETPDGFRLFDIDTNGTIELGPSATGPWTPADVVTNKDILPAHYIRYTPDTNVYGTKAMMSLRAFKGVDTSGLQTVNIVLANVPDAITAASGTFVQPVAPKVTEDIPYTFSFAAVASTLAVNDPDNEPYKLVITGLASGTLTQADDTPITVFPYEWTAGDVKWTGAADAYTKPADGLIPAEAAIAAFTVRAVNTGPPGDQSAVVTFSTCIEGDSDAVRLAGIPTTMSAMNPIPITKGEINILTYDQLRNLVQGTNDYDRTGTMSFGLSGSALTGTIFRIYDGTDNSFVVQYDTFPVPLGFGPGAVLHIIPADGLALGNVPIGTAYLFAAGSSGVSTPGVNLSFQVSAAGGGGGGSTGASSSGSGGCGAGSLTGLMLFVLLPLLRRRR